MLGLHPLSAALALVLHAAASGSDDVTALLERLSGADAGVRAAAVREASRTLGAEHAAQASAFLVSTDAEGERRLVSALGASPRGLDVALAWLGELEPATDPEFERAAGPARVERAAREVFEARIDAWSPGLDVPFDTRSLRTRLASATEDERLATYRLSLANGPRAALEQLTRTVELPCALVWDPAAGDATGGPFAGDIVGTWDGLVTELVERSGLGLDAATRDGGGELEERPLAFLRVTRASFAGRGSGRSACLTWLGAFARGDELARSDAARALGALEWPELQGCFLRRWDDFRDAAALDGLLACAERGRIPPGLATPERVTELLELAGAFARAGDAARADRALRALGRFPRRAADGSDLLPPLLGGFDPEREDDALVRLAVAARWGASSDEFEALLYGLLAAPEASGAMRAAALETWVACVADRSSVGAGLLADPAAILRTAKRPLWALELAGRLERSGWRLPEGFEADDPGIVPAVPPAPRAAWLASLRGPEGARALAARAGSGALAELIGPLEQILRARVRAGRSGEVRASILAALELVEGEGARDVLERLLVRLDVADDLLERRVALRVLGDDEADPLDVAALVAGPDGSRAREALIARFRRAVEDERAGLPPEGRGALVTALERALERLLVAGRESDGRRLRDEVHRILRDGPSPTWAGPLLDVTWPAPPGLVPVDLSALELRSFPGLTGR